MVFIYINIFIKPTRCQRTKFTLFKCISFTCIIQIKLLFTINQNNCIVCVFFFTRCTCLKFSAYFERKLFTIILLHLTFVIYTKLMQNHIPSLKRYLIPTLCSILLFKFRKFVGLLHCQIERRVLTEKLNAKLKLGKIV